MRYWKVTEISAVAFFKKHCKAHSGARKGRLKHQQFSQNVVTALSEEIQNFVV